MAGALKHMERSHRGYHKNVDFTDFHRKAKYKEAQKLQRMSLTDMLRKVIHRTADK